MTRALSNVSPRDKRLAEAHRGVQSLARRPGQHGTGGTGVAIYPIEVFETDRPNAVGDRRFEFQITEELDGATLVGVYGYVNNAGAGTTQIQLANHKYGGGTVDMLTNKITIDSGELRSIDSATPPLINTANDDVAEGDMISVDVDAAAAGSIGMGVVLIFLPGAFAAITVAGAQGDPGGVTNWRGAWDSLTNYSTGDAVSNNGTSYVARTSSTGVEPGVTVGWETSWQILSEAKSASSIQILINGNGRPIDVGQKPPVEVPFDCTLDEVVMLADIAGSAVVDIWKDTYANHPPTNADSITGASPPTITASNKSIDSSLSGWSTTLLAGDVLIFNVDSCSNITALTVSLKVLR